MADVGSDFVFEFLFLLRLICSTCVGVSNILVEVLRFARSSFCRTMLCISAVYAIMQCLSSLNLLFPSLTLIIPHLFFCPYTALLCRHAVSVCLSVSLSHLCILSIRIIISSEIFTLTYHTIVFSYKMLS